MFILYLRPKTCYFSNSGSTQKSSFSNFEHFAIKDSLINTPLQLTSLQTEKNWEVPTR